MILFLRLLLQINLVYFLLIMYLHYLAIKKGRLERGSRYLRQWNSRSTPIFEYTGEWCLPALTIRNCSVDDGPKREIVLQIYWIFGKLFLHIPIKPWFAGEWGFALTDVDCDGWKLTWIHLGKKGLGPSRTDRFILINMPWTFDWYQTSYLVLDPCILVLFWLDDTKGAKIRIDRFSEGFKEYDYKQTFPYLYILKNGTAQHRYATVRQEKRLWRRRCLPFTNLFCLRNHTLSVDFDREVGERAKSWKGGTLGCSWNMLPGESSEQALRRMEATRRFDR
jgi:hypothetical protein